MIDEKEATRLRRVEWRRCIAAAAVAAGATVCSLCLYYKAGTWPADYSITQPALAIMIGLAIVAGARALEGPLENVGGRRSEASGSSAARLVKLWLVCFLALEAAFLVAGLSTRFELPKAQANAKATKVEVWGKLTVIDASGRHHVEVAGREGKKLVDDPVSGEGNEVGRNETGMAD